MLSSSTAPSPWRSAVWGSPTVGRAAYAGSAHPFVFRAGRFNHGLSPRDSLLISGFTRGGSGDPWSPRQPSEEAFPDPWRRHPELSRRSGNVVPARRSAGALRGRGRGDPGPEIDAFDLRSPSTRRSRNHMCIPILRTLDRGDCGRASEYLRLGTMHLARDNYLPRLCRTRPRTPPRRHRYGARTDQPVLDTLPGDRLQDVTWMLRHCPDPAETDIWLARQLMRPSPGRAPMQYPQDANNILVLALMNRGICARAIACCVSTRFSSMGARASFLLRSHCSAWYPRIRRRRSFAAG